MLWYSCVAQPHHFQSAVLVDVFDARSSGTTQFVVRTSGAVRFAKRSSGATRRNASSSGVASLALFIFSFVDS